MFVLAITQGYSQNYLNNFKSDICQCLQEKNVTYKNVDYEYNNCFIKNLVSYADMIDSEIQIEDQTKKYIEGQKIRNNLKKKFSYELMYSCDAYFYVVERGVFKVKENARQNVDSTQLQKFHELVAMSPKWQSYLYRAQHYYKLNDLQNAEKDILKAIELSPYKNNNKRIRAEKMLLGQIYEDQGKYSDAIQLYDKIAINELDTQVEIIKAISVRKRDGRYIPPSDVSDFNTVSDLGNTSFESINKEANVRRREANKNNQSQQNITTPVVSRSRETGVLPLSDSEKPKGIKSKDSAKSLRSLFKLE